MTGKINTNELIVGLRKSVENAKELIEDGNLLLNNKRFARSFTLFQLAIEELGKSNMIFHYVLENDKKKLGKLLKDLKSHKIKTDNSIGFDMIVYKHLDDINKEKLLKSVFFNMENISIVDNFKNYSLYTSIIKNEFRNPSEIITRTHAETHKFYAETRFKMAEIFSRIRIDDFPALIEARREINYGEFMEDFIKSEEVLLKKIVETNVIEKNS